jgi:putative ABC transport system permease protein
MIRLSLANLLMSPLSTAVNILLLALGTASIATLLIATHQLTETLTRDSADIDLVIGAKGSPLQLILAGVYHADVPPGNIALADTKPWVKHPLVQSATPLALGDSFNGFRIVGSTHEYLTIYKGKLAAGELWSKPLEIVVGSQVASKTGLKIGSKFSGVHGLDDGGHSHDEDSYIVVGILQPTKTILDRLLITSMESVWKLHGKSNATITPGDGEGAHDDEHEHDEDGHDDEHEHDKDGHDDEHGHAGDDYYSETAEDDGQEITVLLIKYASPLAALSLPRDINAESALQAASPAFEITRLLQIVGVGIGWLQAFTGILLASAALSIFAALYSSLKARRYDLAVLRCLGATRWQLFSLLFFEGSFLTVAGIFSGLIFAHGGLELIGQSLGGSQNAPLTGFLWAPLEFALVAGLLIAGLLTAIIPAKQAFSTDVAKNLSSN